MMTDRELAAAMFILGAAVVFFADYACIVWFHAPAWYVIGATVVLTVLLLLLSLYFVRSDNI